MCEYNSVAIVPPVYTTENLLCLNKQKWVSILLVISILYSVAGVTYSLFKVMSNNHICGCSLLNSPQVTSTQNDTTWTPSQPPSTSPSILSTSFDNHSALINIDGILLGS